jgi:hypothetical protein
MLSRIDNTWLVGVIQAWWFSYDRLRERFFGASVTRIDWRAGNYRKFLDEQQRHLDSFPHCAE